MEQRIIKFLEEKESLLTDFKEWCKDKSIPTNVRWDLFIKSRLGEIDFCYHEPNGINWNGKSLRRNFFIERNEIVEVEEMFQISEDNGYFESGEDKIKFKEYFLERFLKGFVYDW